MNMTPNRSQGQRVHLPLARLRRTCRAIAIAIAALLPGLAQAASTPAQVQAQPVPQPAAVGTLERVRAAGKLVLGYYIDTPPMSYSDSAGRPVGYAVALCLKVADGMKTQLQQPALVVEWVQVTPAASDQALQQGTIDLLCTANAVTLARREQVSFSAPIFPGGIAGLVRTNATAEFQRHLEGRPQPYKPVWRGTPPAALQHRTASVVAGTPAVEMLAKSVQTLKLITTISTEESYAAGITKVAKGQSDVLFGDRAQLQAQVKQSPYVNQLKVLTRHFTYEPLALALARNDDDFRLAVDRALARFLATPQFGELYQTTFGTADADTIEFFRITPR
jgi:ABC-type amino acid transport substrate-binding protein